MLSHKKKEKEKKPKKRKEEKTDIIKQSIDILG